MNFVFTIETKEIFNELHFVQTPPRVKRKSESYVSASTASPTYGSDQ